MARTDRGLEKVIEKKKQNQTNKQEEDMPSPAFPLFNKIVQ